MIDKIIRLLIILLLLLLPTGLVFRSQIAPNLHVVPQDFVVFAIFLFVIVRLIRKREIVFKKFYKFQFLFLGVGLLSLILGSLIHKDINVIVSLAYFLRYIMYLSLLTACSVIVNKKIYISLITICGSVTLIFGFIQLSFYSDLRMLIYLGWDDHLYRMVSTFLDPNFAGVFFALFFLFLLILLPNKNLKESTLLFLLAFFTAVSAFVTFSRTAIVALVSGVTFYMLMLRQFKPLLLLILAGVFFLSLVSDTKIEGLNPFRTASFEQRISSISDAFTVISKNPLIGVGFNAYRYALLRYDLRSIEGASISNADAGVDNSFLFVFATTGVVGLVLYLASYISLAKSIYAKKDNNGIVLVSMLIAILVSSNFTNILFYTPIMAFYFIVLGTIYNTKEYKSL